MPRAAVRAVPSFAGLYTRLQDLRFDDRFVRELPADPREDRGRRQVLGACHSAVTPTPVAAPRLLAYSEPLAAELGLAPALLHDPAFVAVLAGNAVLPGMRPFAACYGGHQFGNWAGQLGDGRAIGLGELVTPAGARVELQLKGAGPTPYSRAGDGRAVLRSSLREFACSEAMHHLGVPTTRALSLVTTGENVVRDMLYDGNPRAEPGAIVCRTAPSFLRFGNYEIFTSRGETDTLARLLEHTVRHHFPALLPTGSVADAQTWAAWFAEVCERTAAMVVHWMRVGFVHGVMNTDNMSVLGLTIDYGPYGWIDDFDLDWTPNTTDAATRRYRFGQQGQVAAWNLARLARAIAPLLPDTGALEQGLSRYVQRYGELQRRSLADKLGLHALVGDDDDPHGDVALVDELFATLSQTPTDMTIFFRRLGALATASFDASSWLSAVQHAWYDDPVDPAARARMLAWLRRWHERCARDGDEPARRRARMDAANPKYVLRNYLAQEAIDAATAGDLSPLSTLMTVLQHPYDEQPEHERLAAKRPEWARTRVGCSMLSCSS
ncbi:MAG: YdiU family protein [Nannocystaceae bacterium]|nr:YdiU family protein [Nannocystaceae bacterium]